MMDTVENVARAIARFKHADGDAAGIVQQRVDFMWPEYVPEARVAIEATKAAGTVIGTDTPPSISAPTFEYRDEERVCINGCLYLRADYSARSMAASASDLHHRINGLERDAAYLREVLGRIAKAIGAYIKDYLLDELEDPEFVGIEEKQHALLTELNDALLAARKALTPASDAPASITPASSVEARTGQPERGE